MENKFEKLRIDSPTVQEYLRRLPDKVWKILPLYQKKDKGVPRYVDSLLFELVGLEHIIEEIGEGARWITLLSTLQTLSDEIDYGININYDNFEQVRSEILKCGSIAGKMKEINT